MPLLTVTEVAQVMSVRGAWLVVGLVSYVIWRLVAYYRGIQAVNKLPGVRPAIEPLTALGVLIPRIKFWNINPGVNFQWADREDLYTRYGEDTISIVPYFTGTAKLWTANLEVAKQVVAGGANAAWEKPFQYTAALLQKGANLGGVPGGDVWRRHRRIMGPAFNNKTYELVWSEGKSIYRDMMKEEHWNEKSVVDIPVVQQYTFKFALFVIASCGFGLPFKWKDQTSAGEGSMTLQDALRIVSETNFERVHMPRWVLKLPFKRIREGNKAHDALDKFMLEQVAKRRAEIRKELSANGGHELECNDVFSRLVLANESDTEKLPLDDEELIGNTFVLLFAGHETAGNTLAATMGFLGVYQVAQDEVYQQILDVVGNDRDPTFEDFPRLHKVLAAFLEALRLVPAGSVMPRRAIHDTTLTIPSLDDKGVRVLPVPKGMDVFVDVCGIQHNPRYFSEPFKYNPSRWHSQDSGVDVESFTAFSFGPRACIGRKFAMVEAVSWLTMLLRDWRVEIVLRDGETREQWRERVLQAKLVMTLTVDDVPIRLVKRSSPESKLN